MKIVLATMLASMLDPIAAIGYLLAGMFIRRYWLALLAGVVWRSVLALLAPPGAGRFLVPALFGAVIWVSVVFVIRRAFRKEPANASQASGQ